MDICINKFKQWRLDMYNKIITISIMVFFVFSMVGFAADKPDYVGANKCKTCHKAEKNGAQFGIWSQKKHSKAYEALKSDGAKKKAETMGVKDPLKDEKCLSCHATAYGAKNLGKSYKIEEGVTCEACHGPGSMYKKSSVMKDHKKSVEAGMVAKVDEKVCAGCHKKDTPGHEGKFTTFEKEFVKIAHPVPAENDRRKK
jgi:hypothetical protein